MDVHGGAWAETRPPVHAEVRPEGLGAHTADRAFDVAHEQAKAAAGSEPEVIDHEPSAASGRVFINDEQYFEGVKPEWFELHIGGYQVLQKWLKDRKGRKLSHDEITHYQRVVVAIKETIRLMKAIDGAITRWPVE